MKALLVLALTAVVLLAASSTGWEIMFRLGYTMAGILLVSFVWSWGNVRWLRWSHDVKTPRAQVGGKIEERLTLENSSWIPKMWIEIRDDSTLSGHRGNRVVSLGSFARKLFTIETPCYRRGEFTLGPITVASGDPFGLFRRTRRLETGGTVLVYPAITPLTSFGKLQGDLPGGITRQQRTQYTTPNASGVREYQPGDALSRIHWPSSVRQQRLMVKEFELDPLSDVWLLLDLDSEVQVGRDQESTEELAVSVAATLGSFFIDQEREVGVITQKRVLPPDRGQRQLHKLLELLAVVHSESSQPLEEMVISEEARFARGATAVIITPSTDEGWLRACRVLAARGAGVRVVLLEASTFGARQSPLLLVSSLTVMGVPTYLVKKGDDLARTLAFPSSAR